MLTPFLRTFLEVRVYRGIEKRCRGLSARQQSAAKKGTAEGWMLAETSSPENQPELLEVSGYVGSCVQHESYENTMPELWPDELLRAVRAGRKANLY